MNLLSLFTRILELGNSYIQLENGASYYTERNGNTLNIYFEWSKDLRDWINNFKFAAKSIASHIQAYADMPAPWKAHRGFLSVWDVVEPIIKELLKDPSIKCVNISGYSQGSGIALLCHEYVKYNRPDVKLESVGFACPRVLWGKIPDDVKARFEGFTVVRNKADVVTHIPPILFGYKNVGKMITIGKRKLAPLSVIAHLPESYLKALQSYDEGVANNE